MPPPSSAVGAVEQLKTHCARLRVPLYERGYEKDPAKVRRTARGGACRLQVTAAHSVAGVHLAGCILKTAMQ